MSIPINIARQSVGAGWDRLITACYAVLPPNTCVTQVKEKFGGLRFYIDSAPEEVWRVLNAIEDLSFSVCEYCGKPGMLRPTSWTKTLCDACYRPQKHGPEET